MYVQTFLGKAQPIDLIEQMLWLNIWIHWAWASKNETLLAWLRDFQLRAILPQIFNLYISDGIDAAHSLGFSLNAI